MGRFFEGAAAEFVIWLAAGAMATAVAIYIIGKIRAESVQQEPTASELLSKFRDLHARGELSDSEFRTIKTALAAKLQV